MHNDYMPIRGVQRGVYIYTIRTHRREEGRGARSWGTAPLLVLMSNRPEELVQHVWSIWLISLCGQPDANLRSISEIGCEIALAVSQKLARETITAEMHTATGDSARDIHSWWGIDLRKVTHLASQGLDIALGIAHGAYCSPGSNSSSQEMNPTLQK